MTHTPFVYKGMIESQNLNDFYDDLEAIEDNVEEKAEEVLESVVKHPIIQDGTWWIWNDTTSQYEDSEVPATGDDITVVSVGYQAGTSPTTVPTGEWSESPVSVPQGQYLWTKVTYSDDSVSYSVARQGMDGEGSVISVNGQSGVVELDAEDVNAIPSSEKGQANGVAELDEDGKVPEEQLPPISGGGSWGSITGEIEDQEDLQEALDDKNVNVITEETTSKSDFETKMLDVNKYPNSMTYHDGFYYLCGTSLPGEFYKTADFENFTTLTHPGINSGAICYGNGKFVAMSDNSSGGAKYSTDGVTWSDATVPGSNRIACHRIIYNEQIGLFVAVSDPGTYSYILVSSDGRTWTPARYKNVYGTVTDIGQQYVYDISSYGDTVAIATGGNGYIYKDGYFVETRISTQQLARVICSDDGIFALTYIDSAKVYKSVDKGTSWTEIATLDNWLGWNTGFSGYNNGVYYFFKVNTDKTVQMYYSEDTITWLYKTFTMPMSPATVTNYPMTIDGKPFIISIYFDSSLNKQISHLTYLAKVMEKQIYQGKRRLVDLENMFNNFEPKGKVTINGTEYGIKVSTTDSGETGYITFVTEA